jgi:hypothetical protein
MRKLALLVTTALAVVLLTLGGVRPGRSQTAEPAAGEDAKRFIGSWRLVNPDQLGIMIYDNLGNMSVHSMPLRPRQKFAGAQPTADEAKDAITGYLGYFGSYTVDETAHTVTHHRKGSINPGQVGQDAVRHYTFGPNDRLILVPVESGNQIIWQRMKDHL